MSIARPHTSGGDTIGRSINVSRILLPLNRLVARKYALGTPKKSARRTTTNDVSRLSMMDENISGDLITSMNSVNDVAVRRHAITDTIKPKKIPAIRDSKI